MRFTKGITIVQLMIILLLVGVAAQFVVDFIIEQRCETNPAGQLCIALKNASLQ